MHVCCCSQAVGDELLDSIVSDNIPIWTEEEKYNQTVLSSVDRLEAKLTGKEVPGERLGARRCLQTAAVGVQIAVQMSAYAHRS